METKRVEYPKRIAQSFTGPCNCFLYGIYFPISIFSTAKNATCTLVADNGLLPTTTVITTLSVNFSVPGLFICDGPFSLTQFTRYWVEINVIGKGYYLFNFTHFIDCPSTGTQQPPGGMAIDSFQHGWLNYPNQGLVGYILTDLPSTSPSPSIHPTRRPSHSPSSTPAPICPSPLPATPKEHKLRNSIHQYIDLRSVVTLPFVKFLSYKAHVLACSPGCESNSKIQELINIEATDPSTELYTITGGKPVTSIEIYFATGSLNVSPADIVNQWTAQDSGTLQITTSTLVIAWGTNVCQKQGVTTAVAISVTM